MRAFAHSSCRGSYAHAFSPHDEDERNGHRSPVHLIASRFSVTRRISIWRATFARDCPRIPMQPSRARIADFRRYHQTASPRRRDAAIRKLQAHFRQAGHANKVELACASPLSATPSSPPEESVHALMSRHTHARLDPSGQLVHFLLIKLAYRPPSSVVSDPRAAFLSLVSLTTPVLLPPLPLRLHQSTPPIPRSLVSVATVVLIRIKHTSWGG